MNLDSIARNIIFKSMSYHTFNISDFQSTIPIVCLAYSVSRQKIIIARRNNINYLIPRGEEKLANAK